jgi:hypothetical protein
MSLLSLHWGNLRFMREDAAPANPKSAIALYARSVRPDAVGTDMAVPQPYRRHQV